MPHEEQNEFKSIKAVLNEYAWYHSLPADRKPKQRSGSFYLIRQPTGGRARGGPITTKPLEDV